MKRRDLLRGLLAAPLALVGMKAAKAGQSFRDVQERLVELRSIVPSNFQPGQWTVLWTQDGKHFKKVGNQPTLVYNGLGDWHVIMQEC